MYGDTSGLPPTAARRIRARSGSGLASNARQALAAGGHPVRAPQVDAAHLPADGPDRVERLVPQQRGVGRDPAVEQRPHVGAERRGGDDVGAFQVALGDEQEEQVAEVVPFVRADEEHARHQYGSSVASIASHAERSAASSSGRLRARLACSRTSTARS